MDMKGDVKAVEINAIYIHFIFFNAVRKWFLPKFASPQGMQSIHHL